MLDDIADMMTDEDHKQPYILIGTVISNYNPLKPASVKVSLSGKPVGMGITAWAKVAMPSAADGSGIYSLPNVGDEVVVAFLEGEIDMPIVIGSLYGGTKLPPAEVMTPFNNVKMIRTNSGNMLKIDDLQGIKLVSSANQSLELNDSQLSVSLNDSTGQTGININNGSVSVKGLSGINIKSGACEISIDGSGQNVTIKGMSINIEAMQNLVLKGMQVSISGQMVSVSADAQLDMKSAGAANVKGTVLKLN